MHVRKGRSSRAHCAWSPRVTHGPHPKAPDELCGVHAHETLFHGENSPETRRAQSITSAANTAIVLNIFFVPDRDPKSAGPYRKGNAGPKLLSLEASSTTSVRPLDGLEGGRSNAS